MIGRKPTCSRDRTSRAPRVACSRRGRPPRRAARRCERGASVRRDRARSSASRGSASGSSRSRLDEHRPLTAVDIARARPLDLEDDGSQVGEHLRAVRAGDVLRQVEDASRPRAETSRPSRGARALEQLDEDTAGGRRVEEDATARPSDDGLDPSGRLDARSSGALRARPAADSSPRTRRGAGPAPVARGSARSGFRACGCHELELLAWAEASDRDAARHLVQGKVGCAERLRERVARRDRNRDPDVIDPTAGSTCATSAPSRESSRVPAAANRRRGGVSRTPEHQGTSGTEQTTLEARWRPNTVASASEISPTVA